MGLKKKTTMLCRLFATLLATSCSLDTWLANGYKLYDLGGSNQSIIGNNGETNIIGVTGYIVIQNFIVFETRPGESSIKSGVPAGACGGGVIDTSSNKVYFAQYGSKLELDTHRALSSRLAHTISASCIRKSQNVAGK